MGEFVHLHLHSEYSMLDGACRIREIPRAAAAAGHRAVALTDHGVMYGAAAFCRACEANGVKPIIGCEVYVAPDSRFTKEHTPDAKYAHLILLVKNEEGYRNLIAMVSKSFTEGFYSKPRVDFALLAEYHTGLIALSACLSGGIPKAILAGDLDGAKEYALRLKALFGADFYLELQDHGIAAQKTVNRALLELSRELSIPLVATNDVHYLTKEDADAQTALLCIRMNRALAESAEVGFPTKEFYYKSTEEMEALFSDCAEAIANTVQIAEQCNYSVRGDVLQFPVFTPPQGMDAKKYLRTLALDGWKARVAHGEIQYTEDRTEEDYKMRMEYELLVIGSMGYATYYLIVWDFIHYAKEHGIPVGPGRGSGAGSLVAYFIGITDVDSLKYQLLFERFLNPERVSMPDFDVDFCYDRRGEVIRYVIEKYGQDHVSQIVTFGTLAARAAIRDIGRVMRLPYAEVDAVCALIPRTPGITLAQVWEQNEKLREMAQQPQIGKLLDLAKRLEGMPRHISTHAAGVVITPKPVSHYLPLAVSGDTVVTQYDMDTVAELGLLKFDFLGLRYLTVCADTERMVQKKNPKFSLSTLPTDDEATYAMLSHGQTDGVFQLESGGMKQTLMKLQPTCMEDIMVAIALYRPGPMDSIPRFLANRADPKALSYPIEKLEPILSPTYGCIVYQEQVMQICRSVAGYSFGKADKVRRIMAKKKVAQMENERKNFLAGAKQNFIDESVANALFDDMSSFASYAFNKSHAASYAIISYRTAYLKRHYPAEYFAALLSSVLDSQTKTAQYLAEALHEGIRILPPDINTSDVRDTVGAEDSTIRFGMLGVRNIGTNFAVQVVEERKKRPYRSFMDFLTRLTDANLIRTALESAIKAGMFDSLGENRARLLAALPTLLEQTAAGRRNHIEGQLNLFTMDDAADAASDMYDYPDVPEFSEKEKGNLERESTGFYFSFHPLDEFSEQIAFLQATPVEQIKQALEDAAEGEWEHRRVTLVGVISRCKTQTTKNGEPMAFLTLEDRLGEIELVAFPKVYAQNRAALCEQNAVAVLCDLKFREDDVSAVLQRVMPLLPNAEFAKHRPVSPQVPPLVQSEPQSRIPTAAPAEPPTPPVSNGGTRSHTTAPAEVQAANRLFLRLPAENDPRFSRLCAMIRIFEGQTEVCFYFTDTKTYRRYAYNTRLSPYLLAQYTALLGEENVILR